MASNMSSYQYNRYSMMLFAESFTYNFADQSRPQTPNTNGNNPARNNHTEGNPPGHRSIGFSNQAPNTLFHAPVDSSCCRILDLGSHTQIFSIRLAEKFPSAHIYSVAPFNIARNGPKNVTYYLGTLSSLFNSGTLQPQTFDFVFSRETILNNRDWPLYVKLATTLLKPGGWVEMHELNWEVLDGQGRRCGEAHDRAIASEMSARGLDYLCGYHLPHYFSDAGGLNDIGYKSIPIVRRYAPGIVPDGRKAGIGKIMHDLAGGSGRYTEAQMAAFWEEMRRSAAAPVPGVHQIWSMCWGRKPTETDRPSSSSGVANPF